MSGPVSLQGLRPIEVQVEAHLVKGVPSFTILGLASKSVNEAKDRIWSVFDILGLPKPMQKITVNLGPADLQKEGNHYDVPIALSLLCAMGILESLENYIAIGELTLDGRMLPVRGALPIALYAEENNYNIICPEACGTEVAWGMDNGQVIAAKSFLDVINHINGRQLIAMPERNSIRATQSTHEVLIENIEGQADVIWASTLAIGGGHNMLMSGHPGVGKTLIARAMHSLMPDLTPRESIDSSIIYSVSNQAHNGICITPPFRAPHYTASLVGLVGGGIKAMPGEISLAHNGVLFLDEFPEFDRKVIESLRIVLESGEIAIVRANYHITYPAKFILVAAMNPCACGYFGHPKKQCLKGQRCVEQYMQKLSGPILDRFDILTHVKHPRYNSGKKKYSTTAETKYHIQRVRDIQSKRFADYSFSINGHIPGGLTKQLVTMTPEAEMTLEKCVNQLELSMRGRDRVMKLARTISDFSEREYVEKNDILEAVGYRQELLGR